MPGNTKRIQLVHIAVARSVHHYRLMTTRRPKFDDGGGGVDELDLGTKHNHLNILRSKESDDDEEIDNDQYDRSDVPTSEKSLLQKRKATPADERGDNLHRIVRHDIRRHYPRMMVNIFNSHDPNLVQSFFLTYAGKELYLRNAFYGVGVVGDEIGMSQKLLRNNPLPQLEILLNMWHTFSTLHPDVVIEECPTEFYMHPGSRITAMRCQTIIKFTRLYSTNLHVFLKQVIKATQVQALLRGEALSASSSSSASVSSSSDACDDDCRRETPQPSVTLPTRNTAVKCKRLRNKMSLMTPVATFASGMASHFPYQEIDPFELYAQLHQGATIPLLAHPMHVQLRTTSTLYINERRQIVGIDFGAPQIVLGSLYETVETALNLLYNAAWSMVPPALVRLLS